MPMISSHVVKEWKDAATVLDEYMQFDDWKKVDEDAFYDWRLVKKVIEICNACPWYLFK